MLPIRNLVISRGTVIECTKTRVSYRLSTVPGMSGSCVLYQGTLIGIFSPQRSGLILGVHLGKTGWYPSALSFSSPSIINLFQDKDILSNGQNRQSYTLL